MSPLAVAALMVSAVVMLISCGIGLIASIQTRAAVERGAKDYASAHDQMMELLHGHTEKIVAHAIAIRELEERVEFLKRVLRGKERPA